ncbi:MAG: hypothetical protein AAB019_04890 [Planctomycetota bacterium]
MSIIKFCTKILILRNEVTQNFSFNSESTLSPKAIRLPDLAPLGGASWRKELSYLASSTRCLYP